MNYDYHDATLKMIQMNWSTRTVNMEFLLCSDRPSPVGMTMTDVYTLHCPHEAPWGESTSVNAITTTEVPECRVRLEIEMQSGDVIVVEGKEIAELLRAEL